MRVVSNTSPISNLAIIGRLDFLHRRYGTVCIPTAVATELAALTHTAGKQRVEAALSEGWLVVESPGDHPPLPSPISLDPGETAAITLAFHTKADVLLMDERRGREAAREVGLVVAGALGELIHAKHCR
jgi:hypothetical protein